MPIVMRKTIVCEKNPSQKLTPTQDYRLKNCDVPQNNPSQKRRRPRMMFPKTILPRSDADPGLPTERDVSQRRPQASRG